MSGPARRAAAQASYHPGGYGTSPSLQRARQPFALRNAITGSLVFGFAMSVYVYSISAVKQDDFADVSDLLPPADERSNIRTLEDEAAEKTRSLQSIASVLPKSRAQQTSTPVPQSVSSGSASAKHIPGAVEDLKHSASDAAHNASTVIQDAEKKVENKLASWSTRLSEFGFAKRFGLVESGKDNVIVWGAPPVDRVGTIHDGGIRAGKRLV